MKRLNNSFLVNNIKTLMLLVLLMQGICFIGYAQNCNHGRQELKDSTGEKNEGLKIDNKDTVLETHKDPNKIVGLDGYDELGSTDTLRWVSAAQTLAYTVYFENDAELMMAAVKRPRSPFQMFSISTSSSMPILS